MIEQYRLTYGVIICKRLECGTEFTKQYKNQVYCCPKCSHLALQEQKRQWQKRERNGRFAPCLYDPYEGKLKICPDCGTTWETSKRRWVETVCGIEYDKFDCCGISYDRYDI